MLGTSTRWWLDSVGCLEPTGWIQGIPPVLVSIGSVGAARCIALFVTPIHVN